MSQRIGLTVSGMSDSLYVMTFTEGRRFEQEGNHALALVCLSGTMSTTGQAKSLKSTASILW